MRHSMPSATIRSRWSPSQMSTTKTSARPTYQRATPTPRPQLPTRAKAGRPCLAPAACPRWDRRAARDGTDRDDTSPGIREGGAMPGTARIGAMDATGLNGHTTSASAAAIASRTSDTGRSASNRRTAQRVPRRADPILLETKLRAVMSPGPPVPHDATRGQLSPGEATSCASAASRPSSRRTVTRVSAGSSAVEMIRTCSPKRRPCSAVTSLNGSPKPNRRVQPTCVARS